MKSGSYGTCAFRDFIIADSFEQRITKMKIKRNKIVNAQIASKPMPIKAQMIPNTVNTEPMLVHTTN